MSNFFNDDVPMDYQEKIVNKMLFHFEKKNVSALRQDYDHYDFMLSFEVEARMFKIFYNTAVAPGQELELLEDVLKDYSLI